MSDNDRNDVFLELVPANNTQKLLSQYYIHKETGYELRQSGDTTHARKEVTTGNYLFIFLFFSAFTLIHIIIIFFVPKNIAFEI